jgi:hypothetical protein
MRGSKSVPSQACKENCQTFSIHDQEELYKTTNIPYKTMSTEPIFLRKI